MTRGVRISESRPFVRPISHENEFAQDRKFRKPSVAARWESRAGICAGICGDARA